MFKKLGKFKDKLNMYDMMLANYFAKGAILDDVKGLGRGDISIGYSQITSSRYITKYYAVQRMEYVPMAFISRLREIGIDKGISINTYIYSKPYVIDWNSSEMKNRMRNWKMYAEDLGELEGDSIFNFRKNRAEELKKRRIIESTQYLYYADSVYERTTSKVSILIEVRSERQDGGIINMSNALSEMDTFCKNNGIIIKEVRTNVVDWLRVLNPMSLYSVKEVESRLAKFSITDDIIANMNGFTQGKLGDRGIPLGVDVKSGLPVRKVFKEDPDDAENIIVSAQTRAGKSRLVKSWIPFFLGGNMVVVVNDYEGDEYTNLASFIRAGNPEDVMVVSFGKGSTKYFDTMPISTLTGNDDLDKELKEMAITFTLSMFRLMIAGVKGELTKLQKSIVSQAIRNVYDSYGVTNDKSTWHLSKNTRLYMVYEEIKLFVKRQTFYNDLNDNIKHNTAVDIVESCRPFFEDGEAYSEYFKDAMSIDDLNKARFIVFSFGMKGSANNQIDPVVLAMKQVSVMNINLQVSNYCRFVRHCCNVKIWEEYNRWGDAEGSAEIVANAMTGGAKRGDINLLLTNDLASILDDSQMNVRIRQNVNGYIIGKIADESTRAKFCSTFQLKDIKSTLDAIARATTDTGNANSRYKYAFCAVFDNGDKAVLKSRIPMALESSALFKSGMTKEEVHKGKI